MFYTGIFEESKFVFTKVIKNPPPYSDSEIVGFELAGQSFIAISAGPYFQLNPSISLTVACFTVEEMERIRKALSEGGSELTVQEEYPYGERYKIKDRYGLSWRLMLREGGPDVPKITPCLLFSGDACGKAEEAIGYYAKVFESSEIKEIRRYKEGEALSPKARVSHGAFTLDGFAFYATDNGYDEDYTFNEAFSFIVNCKDQKEIDCFWAKLSAVPEAENCGWCKDPFGVSWQVLPVNWEEILFDGSEEQIQRVNKAILRMKKIDMEALMKAKLGI